MSTSFLQQIILNVLSSREKRTMTGSLGVNLNLANEKTVLGHMISIDR